MDLFQGGKLELYIDNKILTRTSIEDFLINETKGVIQNKDDVLICYPNSKFLIPIVLESVINNEIEGFANKEDLKKRTTILIITNNNEFISILKNLVIPTQDIFEISKLQHKALMDNKIFCDINDPYFAKLYWRHILNNYYDNEIPDKVPLHFIFPISRGYHTFTQLSRGEMNKIGRKDNVQESVFLITSNLNALQNEQLNYDYVFIDFSTINKPISNIPKGALYFFDKPLDDRLRFLNKYISKNYLLYGNILELYPNNDLNQISALSRPKEEMITETQISNLIVEYIPSDFEKELEDAYILLKKLIYKNFDSYDLRIIRILLNNITKLPIEGITYDGVAKYEPTFDTISDLIKELKESDNRYEDEEFENIIKRIEDIYNKGGLDTYCPKYNALEHLILKEIELKRTIGIVSSSKIGSIALKEKLSNLFNIDIDRLEELGITFYNKKKLINKQFTVKSDTLILPSATNINDFNVMTNGGQSKTVLFLYSLEIIELKKKFGQLKDIDNLALSPLKARYKDLSIANNIYKYIYNKLKKSNKDIEVDKDFSLDEINKSIKFDNAILTKRKLRDYEGENAIPAVLINTDGGGFLFLRLSSNVRYINKGLKQLKTKKTTELKIGEEIILIDNDSRKDLFNVFIKNIEITNESLINYSMIEKWREKFEDKYISLKIDDDILFRKLKNIGWDKTTKSILRNWRSGYSFGPRDLMDIEILGQALGIKDFIDNSEIYYEAMSKIRVERRVAARILNKIIYLSKKRIDNEDLSFLERFNLSIEDIVGAIKVRKIVGISERIYKVKPSEIGILFESES